LLFTITRRNPIKSNENNQLITSLKQETAPLKRGIRKNKTALKTAIKFNCQKLFEIWADFDDAESPKEVMRLCKGLGSIDAISFMAFCYGYERAVQKLKESL
jgi:hypothetical protein